MKKVVIAISLLIAILFLFLIKNTSNNNFSDESLSIQDGMNTFTEETCVDNFGNKTCVEKTYVECNGEKYNVPSPTGFVVYDKIYINNSIEIPKERLIGKEKPSPSDRISDSDIYTSNSRVRIDIENAKYRKMIDSNSMDPLIDEGATIIEIEPEVEDINIGDIIAFNSDYEYPYVHRVVDIGNDKDGIFFITKGDNYNKNDSKVRFSQIEGIVVGILY